MLQGNMLVSAIFFNLIAQLWISTSPGGASILTILLFRDKQAQAGLRLIKAVEELDLAIDSRANSTQKSEQVISQSNQSPHDYYYHHHQAYPLSVQQGRMSGERSRDDPITRLVPIVKCTEEDGACCRVASGTKSLDIACLKDVGLRASLKQNFADDERRQISQSFETLLNRMRTRHTFLPPRQKRLRS